MNEHPLNWLKVTIHHPPIAAEAVSALLFEVGASGVWEDQPDEQGRQVTRAGFAQEAAESLNNSLLPLVKNLAPIFDCPDSDFLLFMEMEVNHDWAEKWKEGLEPITIGSKLTIAPTWWPEGDLPESQIVLRIDPGLAFGSGHHASTYMCLKLLCDYAAEARRILDVGAGSGILSLASAALNSKVEIIGVDNDPDTISVAEENADDNKLGQRIKFSAKDLSSLESGFDLIVANITLRPLQELAPQISRLASDGGRLILSGLLEVQLKEILETYGPLGWGLQRRLGRDEWSGLLFIKGAESKMPEREEA